MAGPVKPINVVERWSKLKKALVKDPTVKQQPELQEAYKKLFKLFDQGLTKKAKSAEKNFKKATEQGAPDPKDKDKLTAEINGVIALTGQYLKQVEIVKKGFLKKFPQSSGGFSFLSKQLEAIKTHMTEKLKELDKAAG
jgi:ABC-type Zn uptake system ZnuABC Zn-binding protein ZnuA